VLAGAPSDAVETELLRKRLPVTVALFAPLLLRMAPPLVVPELPEKTLLLTDSVPVFSMPPAWPELLLEKTLLLTVSVPLL
jgi:hypothetical protein